MAIIYSIIIPYVILIAFSVSILKQMTYFKGSSNLVYIALGFLNLLSIVGIITILIKIGVEVNWYSPILLGIAGLFLGGLIETIVMRIIGSDNQFIFTLLGFIAIPITLWNILSTLFF